MSEKIVEFENVRKSFGDVEVLKNVSFSLEKSQVLVLVGKSGSGKTTALRCVNGLETIQSGILNVCGFSLHSGNVNLRELRQKVGIVFQHYNLFPHLTVLQNVTLALIKVKKMSKKEAEEVAEIMLSKVGMSERIKYYPEQLSGGQQQRVAIARSLAMKPDLMLFDEVTSALDPELKGEVLKVIDNLAKDGMTMMLVTHEMSFAKQVANKIIFMHQGVIWEEGGKNILSNPKTEELKNFISNGL